MPRLPVLVADDPVLRTTRVVLAAAHLDHDPTNNRPRNLKAFRQRCHMLHDRDEHQRRLWLTLRMRKARGDLFLGLYPAGPSRYIAPNDEGRASSVTLAPPICYSRAGVSVGKSGQLSDLTGRVMVMVGGLSLGSLLHALKLYDEHRHSSGRPVVARLLSSQSVQPLKVSAYTAATIEYKPDDGSEGICDVQVKLYSGYRKLKAGDSINVIPTNISCYQPILPSDMSGYGPDMIVFAISSTVFLAWVWRAVRKFRQLTRQRQQAS